MRRWSVLVVLLAGITSAAVVIAGHLGSGAARTTLTSAPRDHRGAAPSAALLTVATLGWHLPAALSRPVAVAVGGEALLLAGLHAGDVSTADVVRVDPAKASAAMVGSLPVAVHDAGGAALGGTAFVFAGGAATTQSAVQAFRGVHAVVAGSLPVGRSDLAAVTVHGVAYVLGGFDGSELVPAILATRDGSSFSTVGALAQPVRYPAVAALGSEVYVVGGALSTTEGTLGGPQTADIQRFDPATGSTTIIGHLPHVLSHAMALVLGGQLYVLGGRDGTQLSGDIWRIDTHSGHAAHVGSWASPRSDAGAVVIGSVGYLLGGEVSGPVDPVATVTAVRLAH
ncbi:MAG TPA: hypothetical protein VNF07_03420 [Acidimicrobiales bacterium]|nr:hypothetical protein [Acidimicrobiales bacterium]